MNYLKLFGNISLLSVLSIVGATLSAAHAGSLTDTCNPQGISNAEIIICENSAFSKVDKTLSEQYGFLKSELKDSGKQQLLLGAQRAWLKYRDKRCGDVYDAELPGAEAPIARLSCMSALTRNRVKELIYLSTGLPTGDFSKVAAILVKSKLAESPAQAEGLLAGDAAYGAIWDEYGDKNCELSSYLNSENKSTCLNRLKFDNIDI